jgi:hypothetical protein
VRKSHYIRTHVVGGGGIFDTIANIVKRITDNTVGDLTSKLVISVGKSMASEAGKRLASRFIAAPTPYGVYPASFVSANAGTAECCHPFVGATADTTASEIPQNAINHQAKLYEIIGKYNGSGVTSTTPHHNAITIQDLVRKMHQGSGLKMT